MGPLSTPWMREGANGVDEDAERGDSEVVAVDAPQRVADGGAKVGAAADGLGDEDFRTGLFGEFVGGVNERGEAAAEAAPRDFFDGEAVRAEHGGVDEAEALVVGDEPDFVAAGVEVFGEFEHCGGFAGAEEASKHDVLGFRHRV